MNSVQPLPEATSANLEQLAALNKAAGDPLRLEILRVLANDAFGVLELSQIFDLRQSGMSHHLKVLAEVGLVAKRREGNSIFYSRTSLSRNPVFAELLKAQFNSVDALPLSPKLTAKVDEVRTERATVSQQFFAEKADGFKEQQDLIAKFPVYGDAVAQMLTHTPLPALGKAVEVGPGTGDFLPVLASRFNRVTALDNADAMLQQARTFCSNKQFDNIDFVCDNTQFLHQQVASFDCAVMNMVLHHTPSPAEIFRDISVGLKSGGVFILAELCRHDQEWARSACGDLWLGFDAEELNQWAQAASLTPSDSHYLALRNGFQIQLQQFIK